MASKGQKFKHWTKEEKLRIVKKIVEEGKSSYALNYKTPNEYKSYLGFN